MIGYNVFDQVGL